MVVLYNINTKDIIMGTKDDQMENEWGILTFEVEQGKELAGIDENDNPIFIDKPISIEERLAALEASQNDQDDAIAEIAEIITE